MHVGQAVFRIDETVQAGAVVAIGVTIDEFDGVCPYLQLLGGEGDEVAVVGVGDVVGNRFAVNQD